MNKFIMGARADVFSLATSQYATAQTAPAKPTAKKAPAKKRTTKKAKPTATAKPEGVQWRCELGNELYVVGDMTHGQVIKLHWKDKNYDLPRRLTRTGADRYFDQKTGFNLVVVPAKTMLFDRSESHRLVDEYQTAEMAAGAPAPTQAGALCTPASLPLVTPDSSAPTPVPAPGTAQPTQQ